MISLHPFFTCISIVNGTTTGQWAKVGARESFKWCPYHFEKNIHIGWGPKRRKNPFLSAPREAGQLLSLMWARRCSLVTGSRLRRGESNIRNLIPQRQRKRLRQKPKQGENTIQHENLVPIYFVLWALETKFVRGGKNMFCSGRRNWIIDVTLFRNTYVLVPVLCCDLLNKCIIDLGNCRVCHSYRDHLTIHKHCKGAPVT